MPTRPCQHTSSIAAATVITATLIKKAVRMTFVSGSLLEIAQIRMPGRRLGPGRFIFFLEQRCHRVGCIATSGQAGQTSAHHARYSQEFREDSPAANAATAQDPAGGWTPSDDAIAASSQPCFGESCVSEDLPHRLPRLHFIKADRRLQFLPTASSSAAAPCR